VNTPPARAGRCRKVHGGNFGKYFGTDLMMLARVGLIDFVAPEISTVPPKRRDDHRRDPHGESGEEEKAAAVRRLGQGNDS